jgi:hypothetical protein
MFLIVSYAASISHNCMFIIFTCFALFIACTKIEKKQPVDEIDQEIMIHEALIHSLPQ